MLSAAIAIAAEGWRVFPCDADKRPRVLWRDEATSDPDKIVDWWERWPESLIGLPTGGPAGVVVVDVDVKHGNDGPASLESAQRTLGALPRAPISRTRSGGWHAWYRCGWASIRNSAGKLGRLPVRGVDLRGEGGFVIVPPSCGYSWERGNALAGDAIPDLPDAWVKAILRLGEKRPEPRPPSGNPSAQAVRLYDAIVSAPLGCRNDTLTRIAFVFGKMVSEGSLVRGQAISLLRDAVRAWPSGERDEYKDESTWLRALEAGEAS